MKMGPGLFWGILLLVVGIALVIKVIFRLDIPVVRIAIGVVLVLAGIRILVGGNWIFFHDLDENEVIFREMQYSGKEAGLPEYSVVFGSAVFDFTDLDSTDLPKQLKISTVFGASTVFLSRTLPVKLEGEAVFAGATLPGGNTTVFGSTRFESEGFDPSRPYLSIKAEVVFGAVEIKYRD